MSMHFELTSNSRLTCTLIDLEAQIITNCLNNLLDSKYTEYGSTRIMRTARGKKMYVTDRIQLFEKSSSVGYLHWNFGTQRERPGLAAGEEVSEMHHQHIKY